MIVHAFISRDDDWILGYHLAAYSEFCDRIVVVLDDWPQSEAICRRFPRVDVIHRRREIELGVCNDRGVLMEEGRLRQLAWDRAMEYSPDLVVLGDSDEAPTPDVVEWIRSNPDPAVDVWYADWVNLAGGLTHAIGGGRSEWSFQVSTNNKKGFAVRPRPGREYRYRDGVQHVRMEPSPLSEALTVHDHAHRLGPVKLVHYKWANWPRWESHPLSRVLRYQEIFRTAELVPVPPAWLWPFSIPGLK